MSLSAIFGVLDKVLAHLTPAERKRRLKEQLTEIERKINEIMAKETATVARSRKLDILIRRKQWLSQKLITY